MPRRTWERIQKLALRDFWRRPSERPLAWLGRDLSVAFTGHFLSKGLGILTFIVMTRSLAPAEYGIFMLAYSVFEIGLYLSDLGLDTGTTRFVAKGIRHQDEEGTRAVLKAVFLTKVAAASIVFVLGYLAAPFVAREILVRPEMTPYLRIAHVGIFGAQLSGFFHSYFAARLQFVRNALFSMVAPLGILLAVLGIWRRGDLDVWSCLVIYVGAPLVVCAITTAVLGRHLLGARTRLGPSLRAVWRFSRWIYVTNVLGTVRFRLNSILLARYATLPEVGLYNYGDKLASILTLFTSSITTVLVPRASHLLEGEELRALLRSSYRFMLLLVPALLVVPFVSRPLIAFLAPAYVEAAPIFSVLFVSILFSLAALPSSTVLYSVNQPHVETVVEMIALLLTLVGGYLLVRSHGGIGAAAIMLIQRTVSASLVIGWVYAKVYRPAASVRRGSSAAEEVQP